MSNKQGYTFYFNIFQTLGLSQKRIIAMDVEQAYEMLSLKEKQAIISVVDDDGNEYDENLN